jgi:hypothetical protein
MSSSSLLKTVEEKMNDALLAYTERDRHDSELHRRLIENLRTATTEFLETRWKMSRGLGRQMP